MQLKIDIQLKLLKLGEGCVHIRVVKSISLCLKFVKFSSVLGITFRAQYVVYYTCTWQKKFGNMLTSVKTGKIL